MASRPLAAGAAVSGMHRSRPLARLPPGADLFSRKARAHVTFSTNPATLADPHPDAPEPDDLNNPHDLPGR